jgi:hypothetical protein
MPSVRYFVAEFLRKKWGIEEEFWPSSDDERKEKPPAKAMPGEAAPKDLEAHPDESVEPSEIRIKVSEIGLRVSTHCSFVSCFFVLKGQTRTEREVSCR